MKRRSLLQTVVAGTIGAGLLETRFAQAQDPPPAKPGAKTLDARTPDEILTVSLNNGARFLAQRVAGAKTIALSCSIRVGSVDDGRFPGITSLLARLLGNDSESKTAALLRDDIQNNGAFGTDYDGQVLTTWAVCAANLTDFQNISQTLLLNAVAKPRFDADAVARARDEQLRVQSLREDGPLTLALRQVRARAFGTEADPLGDEATLRSIGPERLAAFHADYFRPERASVAVVGEIAPGDARQIVESALNAGGWSDPKTPAPIRPILPEPIPAGLREIVLPRRAPAAIVCVGYLAPGVASKDNAGPYASLLVLDTILGAGKASRLFALRENSGLGYEVRSVLSPGPETSLWSAYIIGDRPTADVLAALDSVCSAIGSGTKPIADAEIARAKALLVGSWLLARQQTGARARALSATDALGVPDAFDARFAAQIDAVTRPELEALARKIFTARRAVVRTSLRA